MEREDSLVEVIKIPKRRLKLRRNQTFVSSTSDVIVSEATSEERGDLLVSGLKLRSKKNLDGNEARTSVAGTTNLTPPDRFEEEEQMLLPKRPPPS